MLPDYQKRDHSYFDKMDKAEIVSLLSKYEMEGALQDFIQKVAPDYILPNGEVLKFSLLYDLGLL